MQREKFSSSQIGLTSGIRRGESDFITTPGTEKLGRNANRRGKLWILTEPASASGGASSAAKLVMETIEDEYYHGPAPTITTALEEAVSAANRLLHEYNAGAPTHKQAFLGVSCVAIHGSDVYVAQVQPARVIVVHQGAPTTFPNGAVRTEAELTPLGLDGQIEVELYRSPFAAGDTVTLLSDRLARIVGRAEDEYGLSYQEHTGAVEYLAHLAARENLLDAHALVIEQPARRKSGASQSSLKAMGREWARDARARAGSSIQSLAALVHRDKRRPIGDSGPTSFIATQAKGVQDRLRLPRGLSGAQPSRLQAIASVVGVALLVVLALGLGTRAYQGYRERSALDSLLAAAEQERQQARGKPTENALQHLRSAKEYIADAQKIDPAHARVRTELRQLASDYATVNRVVYLEKVERLTQLGTARQARASKVIVVGPRVVVLEQTAGRVYQYDTRRNRRDALSPKPGTRFVGLSWRDGGLLLLDATGKLHDYDMQAKTWRSVTLAGKLDGRRVVSFDTFGTRAFIAARGADGVSVYNTLTGARIKVLKSPIKGQPLAATSVSADGNLWLLNGRDESIWKFANDKVSRRLWVDAQPPIRDGAGLVVTETNQYVYMLDEQRDRVLQVTAAGQLQAQIYLPRTFKGGKRIDAVYADESAGKLYLVIGGGVYAAPLPKAVPVG